MPTLTCSQANSFAVKILGSKADGVADEGTTIQGTSCSLSDIFTDEDEKELQSDFLEKLARKTSTSRSWSGVTASRPRRTTTTTPSSRFSRTAQEEEEEEEVAALLPEDKPHKPQSTEPTAFDRWRGLLQC